jgi:hypothetical protein
MDIKDGLYSCKICCKEYSSYKSLWNHNKKFHTIQVIINHENITNNHENITNNHENITNKKCNIKNNHNLNIIDVNPSKNTCKYCYKQFKYYQNKWDHEKNYCKNKITLQKENINLKNELEIIKNAKQIINYKNIENNTTNNSINNGIINNNYVVINKFGTEKIADVPINDIRSIINSDINSVITCTKKVNFNKKLPQYHSFCTTTLEGDHFTKINHKTQKPEKINKKDFINEVLNSSIKFLNDISIMIEFDEEFRNKISLEEQEKIKNIIKYQDKFNEVKNKRAFFQSINDISYNCKDLILKTWKNIQPLEENYDSDDNYYSEPDIDPSFKGYESSDTE